MQTLHIKTFAANHKAQPHQFFILSKGNNTGKPLDQPCPNCFVVTCCSEKDRERFYWLSFALWQSGIYRRHLVGSVIQFIHIAELRKMLTDFDRKLDGKLGTLVKMLQTLNQVELKLKDQLVRTRRMKSAFAQPFSKLLDGR